MPDYNPQDYAPSYGGQIDSNGNIKNIADAITGSGANTKLKVDIGSANVSLNASDVQMGAVEVKDAVNDNRLSINSSGHIGVYIMGSIDGGGW